jgi:large conductance mechanosensitive channel
MANKTTDKTLSEKHKDIEVKNAKADARLAKAEALRAKAEAAAAKAAQLGGGPVQGFVDFIREKGVVGLAIGLAIGTAATGLVSQIVNAVITPTVSLLLGLVGLESLKGLNFVVKRAADGTPLITYAVGDLIDALIKFLAIAAVIYFVVIGLKLDRLDKKKDS